MGAQPAKDFSYVGFRPLKETKPTALYVIRQADLISIEGDRTARQNTVSHVDVLQTVSDFTGRHAGYITYPLNKRLLEGFCDIARLDPNWDSYGANAPSLETVEKAKKVASFFPPRLQPEIYPEKDGSIGLYWDYFGITYFIGVSANTLGGVPWYIEDESGEQVGATTPEPLERVIVAFLDELRRKTPWAQDY